VADRHQFVDGLHGLIMRRMQNYCLSVAGCLQVTVGLGADLAQLAQQRVHIAPRDVTRDRVGEDGVVGALMRAG
jgi:hypothetical protein